MGSHLLSVLLVQDKKTLPVFPHEKSLFVVQKLQRVSALTSGDFLVILIIA